MKRKVIQHGKSSLIVSLPLSWTKRYNIGKGDELDVDEKGRILEISTGKGLEHPSATVDITDLDRTSILYLVQALYRRGFDEINLRFKNVEALHYRTEEKKTIISVVHEGVNRLIGIEVTKATETSCEIREVSETSSTQFENILRRLFLVLIDTSKDFVTATRDNNIPLMQTIEEKHDTVTKFVSFCLRLLSKYGYEDYKKTLALYHFIAQMDKIADILKYSARDVIQYNKPVKKETVKILEMVHSSEELCYDMFYKFSFEKVRKLSENRDAVKHQIKTHAKNLPAEEVLLLNAMLQSLELILDMTEFRMAIEC